ncbi:ketohydroxyglutarate aldolase [Pediococcus pentosaceus]|nr:ketohydroxyglutarate aldolase [Pediococcus pentosaceus]MCM6792127.1 ketohydroxyglutarate aldolase [Pediococcus pentosaceus]MCM6809424.1 ketohydroxyglutarate aldolase [Pediococcus pentosaceus]MCM6818714.1 ketohydroxyglutarate aldolase [Pediococcus pentosaceus]MDN3206096.1 ketohydroxyglutarate aldolase [Pediococcus pentosaceus]
MSVIRADVKTSLGIAEAGLKGGVKLIELSFTEPTALTAIKEVKKAFPEIIVGAGTVLDAVTARIAILGGADFILSPAFDKEVALMANRYQVPYLPGCNTVSESVDAMTYGASFIKVFPGSALSGPKWIKIVKTPIPNMPILASGGGTFDNFNDFLNAGADCVAFGGLLVNGELAQIEENARKLTTQLSDYRKLH